MKIRSLGKDVDLDDLVWRVGADWSYDTHTETHKCKLCEKPMSVYYVDYVGAPVSYYCDNYRCPLSWKFRAYLMGKFDPEDCVWSTFDGDGNAYMFTKATRTHYTGNLEWSNPDCDPGTLM